MFYNHRIIVLIISILIFVDYGGDAILRAFPIDRTTPDQIFKFLISLLSFVFMISFGLKLPKDIKLLYPFILFIFVIFGGLAHGLLVNNPLDAINEAIPFLFILLFLAFSSMKKPLSIHEVEQVLKLLVIFVFLKLITYMILSYAFYGVFAWKVLTKQAPLLVIPLSVFLSNYILKNKYKGNSILLLLIITCIMFAQARMLILSSMFIFSYYFLGRSFIKSLPLVLIIGFSFQLYLILIGESASDVGSFFYGGDAYEEGLSYRLIQLEVISNRLIESPIFGKGFGHFTPGYLTYDLLAKPYLLELDILNFISKIGIAGTLVYGFAYIQIFQLIKKISNVDVRRLATALFISLIALMIYSLGQTTHQSVNYWIFLAFVYGFIVSHLKAQFRK